MGVFWVFSINFQCVPYCGHFHCVQLLKITAEVETFWSPNYTTRSAYGYTWDLPVLTPPKGIANAVPIASA